MPASNDLRFRITPVLSLNIKPVPEPTFAAVVELAALNKVKAMGSVPIIAVGVVHK